ncbi:metallophosphoesterase family protein [Paenibacillus xylanexedens]|uniref:metallophosphoesterase family protein n=1 Tax=Paenibacillus xylanexedens TaxID=528191 RepID=UPI000F520AA7|nr:metallophosphoesterase family protein [Paenibacillus xylanexedens]
MSVWYTSDSHFSHNNIIQHENRPFNTTEEMNKYLIEQWNNTVSSNDTVYHLGDLVFGGITRWESIIPRLNGKIHLAVGNHDNANAVKKMAHHFEEVENMIVRKINKQHLFLFHYPIEIGLTPNAYSIHGHIHSRPSNYVNQINVGIDSPFTKNSVGFGNLIPEELILEELKTRKEQVLDLRSNRE